MTAHGVHRTAVRQAIASLLRLAHADARDARTLAEAGGTRNAASLLHSAISRLIEAVVASEQGYTGPPEVRRIDARNPLKPALLQLDAVPEAPSILQRDGRLAEPPSAAAVLEPLGSFAEALERFVQHCGVDLDGSGPAENADPPRPADAAPPPLPAPTPKPRRAKTTRRQAPDECPSPSQTRSKTAAPPKPAAPPQLEASAAEAPKTAAHSPRLGLTSGIFWSLVDHWQLADLDALQLIGRAGGLTQKGTRPRFKLNDAEAEVVSAMRSLDDTLSQLRLESAEWLSKPLRADPFQGAAPLDVIRKNRLQGLRDVRRYLTQMGLRLSLQQG